MRRVTIRNLKSLKPVKPRLFDAIVDKDEVYIEIKNKKQESEIISLEDIYEQIAEPDRPPPKRKNRHPKWNNP